MILNKVDSRNFVVNALANIIVDEIGIQYSSIIKVFDFKNFFVIKGRTNSKEILNLKDITNKFHEKYEGVTEFSKITNTIDLIEYDCKIEDVKSISVTLFNSDKCDYHYEQIEYFQKENKSNDFCNLLIELNENDMVYESHFPNGYSFSQGKSLYYFIKKLFYSLPSSYPFTTLTITVDENSTDDNFIKVFNHFSREHDEILQSCILDSLDFNVIQVIEEMKKVDSNFDLVNPLSEHPYLKDGKKFIII